MSLAVDRYELGPVGTNCYVVRRERGAQEAVVVDPGGDAAQLRRELAGMGAACAGIRSRTRIGIISGVSPISPRAPARRSTCRASKRLSSRIRPSGSRTFRYARPG